MAIKDWKEVRNNNSQIAYKKTNKNVSTFVVISNIFDNASSWSVGISQNIIIEGDVRGREIDYKLFKTKTQALNYAKHYMRTH